MFNDWPRLVMMNFHSILCALILTLSFESSKGQLILFVGTDKFSTELESLRKLRIRIHSSLVQHDLLASNSFHIYSLYVHIYSLEVSFIGVARGIQVFN